jgi:hypothetical protein
MIAVDHGVRNSLSHGYFDFDVTSIPFAELVDERLEELREPIHKRRNVRDPAREGPLQFHRRRELRNPGPEGEIVCLGHRSQLHIK